MGERGKKSTGGNTEPMPFVRKWGASANSSGGAAPAEPPSFSAPPPPAPVCYDDIVAGPAPPPPEGNEEITSSRSSHEKDRDRRDKDRGDRDRRRDKDRDRDHRRRSRSRDRERGERRRHRSKSSSRDRDRDRRRRRDRSRSHDRRRDRSRDRSRSPAAKKEKVESPAPAPQEEKSTAPSGGLFPIGIKAPTGAQSLLTRSDLKPDEAAREARRKERKSRWSCTKSFVPGMPTILPSDLSEEQRQGYLLQLEIEEATRKLRLGDFIGNPDPKQRSPSPEPIYDSNGKRLNTREIRKRQELEQLRHEKIQNLLKLNPNYKPPADYRMPNIRLHDKVWIPQEEHPEINFVGLLIGPRGNTLKALETETGAKIIIRGKGSVKEGKLGRREGPMPGENEPLHAYVTGTDSNTIKKACEKIRSIINEALNIPDGQNELRKLQLRELALLNGTLRPEDAVSGMRCSNCGSDQHKSYECPDAPNVTANIICSMCGGAGHIARDCKTPRTAIIGQNGEVVGMDDEYTALMAELGEQPKDAAPIVRVNLTQRQQPQNYSWGAAGGAVGSQWHTDPSAAVAAQYLSQLHGGNQQHSLNTTVESAAAYAAWSQKLYGVNGEWQGEGSYPMPVPPPPSEGVAPVESKPTPAELAQQAMNWAALYQAAPPPPPPVDQ
uniref:Branchpoint-bridging protein n=1 Tax=Steinernema glaseri TaxID=37863 RepID=A0A1I7ZDE2_9BILA